MPRLPLHRFRLGSVTATWWCAAVLISLCSSCSGVYAQSNAEVLESPAESTDWATALTEAGLAEPVADELRSEEDWLRLAELVSALLGDDRSALLSDTVVLDALLGRMDQAPTPVLIEILTILRGDFRRDAIRKVIPLLNRDDPALRAFAMRTLIDQTGREDLGSDADAWRQWWSEHEWIPEIDWLRRISHWQGRRAQMALASSREAQRERIQTLRELYSATIREKRPDLLLRLFRDPATDARLLGVELASREVVNATRLSEETLDAALDLLSDAQAELRAGAARLFNATTSAHHHQSLSEALTNEEDPGVAGALLAALSAADPSRADIAAAVKWISYPAAQASAAHVLFAATDSGKLDSPSQRLAVWDVIAEDAGVSLGAVGVRLFGRLAPASDIEMLFALIHSSNEALRSAAARSLAERGAGMSELLDAARSDTSLTSTSLAAISFWTPTAEGWSLGRTLAGATDKDLASLAAALPAGEILDAARQEASASHRLLLLDRFKEPAALEPALPTPDLTEGVILRLATLLDLGLFEDLLRQPEPPEWMARNPRVVASVHVALVALGHFDEAEQAEAQMEAWFDALDRLTSADSDLAPAAARRFRQVWSSDLSDTDRERLIVIEKKLGIDVLAMPDGDETETNDQKKG